jgi:DNA-binding MarR family transcriptional regulator
MPKLSEVRKNAPNEEPDDDSELETMLCFAVYSAALAFTRSYKPLLDPLGLTYPQYLVMRVLWSQNGQKVKALADRLGLDSAALSPLLKRLEQAGLVDRKRGREDERQVIITLTAAGLHMKGRLAGVKTAITKAAGCTPTELAALRDNLVELKNNLEGVSEVG